MLRGLLGEFGIVIARGIGSAVKFAKSVLHGDWPSIPEVAMDVLTNLCDQMVALHLRIISYDKRILLEGRKDPKVMLLRTLSEVGPATASATVTTASRRASVPRWARICGLAGAKTHKSVQRRQ